VSWASQTRFSKTRAGFEPATFSHLLRLRSIYHSGRFDLCTKTFYESSRVARWFIFKPKIPIFGLILEGLGTENVGIFYDHLKYFRAIWYTLWSFGIGSMWSFGITGPRKIWQPWKVEMHHFSNFDFRKCSKLFKSRGN
jgi:hypothetical protein